MQGSFLSALLAALLLAVALAVPGTDAQFIGDIIGSNTNFDEYRNYLQGGKWSGHDEDPQSQHVLFAIYVGRQPKHTFFPPADDVTHSMWGAPPNSIDSQDKAYRMLAVPQDYSLADLRALHDQGIPTILPFNDTIRYTDPSDSAPLGFVNCLPLSAGDGVNSASDLSAQNGHVHGVAGLVLPTLQVMQSFDFRAQLSFFKRAVEAVPELSQLLGIMDGQTIFAPTDEAWQAYLNARELTEQELFSQPEFETLMRYHVFVATTCSGVFSTEPLVMRNDYHVTVMRTAEGTVQVKDTRGSVAEVVLPDYATQQGVTHGINRVLEFDGKTVDTPTTTTATTTVVDGTTGASNNGNNTNVVAPTGTGVAATTSSTEEPDNRTTIGAIVALAIGLVVIVGIIIGIIVYVVRKRRRAGAGGGSSGQSGSSSVQMQDSMGDFEDVADFD